MKVVAIAAALLLGALAQAAVGADVQTATGTVTLESATDHVEPVLTGSGSIPGRDVARFQVTSDGTDLTLTATLAKPASGTRASEVVRMFVDADDNAATGSAATYSDVSGFEFEIDLNLCVAYENGVTACAGEVGTKAASYFATAAGKKTESGEELKAAWDLPQTPVEGNVVTARIPYVDLGLKPGQTVRFYARESSGPFDATSYFPEVRLILK